MVDAPRVLDAADCVHALVPRPFVSTQVVPGMTYAACCGQDVPRLHGTFIDADVTCPQCVVLLAQARHPVSP